MLYRTVRWIARLTIRSYFKRIIVLGRENIPSKGPVIFVANHPSAFMDPIVVAFSIDRTLHFLAAAEFFGKGIKSWFYQKHLNMIPVYRPATLPDESYKNDGVFTKCIELLAKGGSILIFPEGNSVTEKRIRKLKTGVARMAIGSKELARDVQISIIPVGLNYSNPHRFRSELFINIGNPISINQYALNKEDVIDLTSEVERKLKETVYHIPNEELDSLIKKVELIVKRNFSSNEQKGDEFIFQQKVIEAVQKLSEQNSNAIMSLESRLDDYLNNIRLLGISDNAVANLSILVSLRELLVLVLSFPVFLFGFLVNLIPYYATVNYFRKLNLFQRDGFPSPKKNVRSAFFGSIAMSIGVVFFIIYYIVITVTCVFLFGGLWMFGGLWIIFYLTGLFALQYIQWFYGFDQKRKLRNLILRKRDVFASLIMERQKIINEIMSIVK